MPDQLKNAFKRQVSFKQLKFVNTDNTSLVKDRDIIGDKYETLGSRQSMLKAEQKPKQRL